jgi:porphobilinogen synthase
VAAYQVSGEHAAIRFAAEHGALDLRQATLESLIAIRRAGAQVIMTYSAIDVAGWLG